MAIETPDIRFPLAGLSKIQSFESQEPYSTPYALNCRPQDVFERRLRGGSRPQLSKSYATDAGTGYPVRLLNTVLTGQELSQDSSFEDPFDEPLADNGWSLWSQQTSPTDAPVLPTLFDGKAVLADHPTNQRHVGAVHDLIDYNADAPVEIETSYWTEDRSKNFKSNFTNTKGVRWRIAFGLASAGDYTGGCVIGFADINGSGDRFDIVVYNQGSTLLSEKIPPVSGNVLRAVLTNGTLQIFLGSTNNLVYTVNDITLDGKRIAFGMWHPTGLNRQGFEYLNLSYTPVATATPIAEPAIIKSTNGTIYYESASQTIVEVTGQDTDLASDRLLVSGERFGKLYIADYYVKADGEDGTLAGTGTTFNSATYDDPADPNWTELTGDNAIDTDGDYIELLAGGSGTYTPGVYAISAVAAGGLTIEDAGDSGASSIPWRIVRGVKVFDYRLSGANKLTKLTRKSGTTVGPPLGCKLLAIWSDRLCLSGDEENPGDTFMSAQGDFTNWEEDTTDQSPVYGEFDINTRINEPTTALVPFTTDYLVFGTLNNIHVLRGNPVRGGVVDGVSKTVGILGAFAWCITPEGLLVVMTGDGLYAIDQTARSAEPISRERLPREFLGLDIENNDVQLGFDVGRNGILVAVTPKISGSGTFYWFDWQTKGFWPESYNVDHHPTAMTSHVAAGESTARLVLGCRDGYLREHMDSATSEDGLQMDSDILIGPLMLGAGGYWEGMLYEVIPQMASQSGRVLVSVQTGRSIEDAYNAIPVPIGTALPGKNFTMRPNRRGNCCFIRISSIDGARWAYEQMTISKERVGQQRIRSA